MSDGEGPARLVNDCRPFGHGMEKNRARSGLDETDRPFGDTVLPVAADATVGELLGLV